MNDVGARMMELALQQAQLAVTKATGGDQRRAEVPVGAVIHDQTGAVIACGHNEVYQGHDVTAHAEMVVLRAACAKVGHHRLDGLELCVTLEPCTMCAGAIGFARIARLRFGAFDVKQGAVTNGVRWFDHPSCVHRCAVTGGLMEARCRTLLTTFFQARRG